MNNLKAVKRRIWHGMNGLVNGYIPQSTNLTNVVLTNAGTYESRVLSRFGAQVCG
jgi:hypothetical protein